MSELRFLMPRMNWFSRIKPPITLPRDPFCLETKYVAGGHTAVPALFGDLTRPLCWRL